MATAKYVTTQDAQTVTANLVKRAIIPKDTPLTCDTYVWEAGKPLAGRQRIYEPAEYANLFVEAANLRPYSDVPTEPPAERFVAYHHDGTVEYFFPKSDG